MNSDPTKQRDVGAVVHAMQILQHLASLPSPQGAAAVSRATGISPSTSSARSEPGTVVGARVVDSCAVVASAAVAIVGSLGGDSVGATAGASVGLGVAGLLSMATRAGPW